jgi:hypothetical protein
VQQDDKKNLPAGRNRDLSSRFCIFGIEGTGTTLRNQEPWMESLTRLVSESLARHGFDRPVDYRRLQWSRWFRCQSHHSLLLVPSRPGVFALAEEIVDFDSSTAHGGPNADIQPRSGERVQPTARAVGLEIKNIPSPKGAKESDASGFVSGHGFSRAESGISKEAALAAGEAETAPRRMLAVTQFFEDDDMAFVLERMLSLQNPMRAQLMSGRYFVRYVVISDESQRRSVCAALNQWITNQALSNPAFGSQAPANAAEKLTGIGPHFAASLELTPATEYVPPSGSYQGTASALPKEAFSYRSGLGR